MPIAFDASGGDTTWAGPASTRTISHTCTGSDRILFASIMTYGASVTVSGATYNGVAMTKAVGITAALEGSNQIHELWYLKNPATGANNVVFTLSGSVSFLAAQSVSYTGYTASSLESSASAQNVSTNNTAAPACNVTITNSDCWIVGSSYTRDSNGISAGSGTTQRKSGAANGWQIGDSNGVVGTGTQTLAWNSVVGNKWPGVLSAAISASGGGGGGGGLIVPSRKIIQAVNRAGTY
jgi:hypothetical protein